MRKNNFNDIVDQVISHGVHKGILHLYSENASIASNTIVVKGHEAVNFGSCSYLGLEHDERLKEGAKRAIEQFGTQFSSSRAYLSLGLYHTLENLFENIFNAPCIVAPTTTLGHLSNLPVLVEDDEAVIIDQQAHNSMQMAVALLKSKGVYTEIIRHNRMDLLQERIALLQNKYNKVWYLADGVYSMYGNTCDIEALYSLMDKYECLHCYIDDAHGMSIYGEHGRGFVLNGRSIHSKLVVATSLAKAFATGGAVLVYPDKELARRVRTCGGPLITSGPLQPANLGAAIACAEIHLSPEIYKFQQELQNKVQYAHALLVQEGLPVISNSDSAVCFVGVGVSRVGYNLVSRMLRKGYYVNLGVFPAVPMKNTGIRFTITRLHSLEQIETMIKTLAAEFSKALAEEHVSLLQIYKAFKMPGASRIKFIQDQREDEDQKCLFTGHYKTITAIDRSVWDGIYKGKGTFDWDGMLLLERSFSGNAQPENNWLFDYLIIKDCNDTIIVATFLTTALWKDDMLSTAGVSALAEQLRAANPYHLTSTVIATGSLLTEGEHVFINKNSALWKDALLQLLKKMQRLQELYKANSIVWRDFHDDDAELDRFFLENDFIKMKMPDTNIISDLSSIPIGSFYDSLSRRSRQHFREDVRKHIDKFEVRIVSNSSEKDIAEWYELYVNVKNHNLSLNTFRLPIKLFCQLAKSAKWETIVLKLRPQYAACGDAVCVVWCYRNKDCYVPMIIGIDYTYNKEYKVYRQALYQIVVRALALNTDQIYFGFAASIEKKKLGAKQLCTHGYIQYKDGYNLEVLSSFIQVNKKER